MMEHGGFGSRGFDSNLFTIQNQNKLCHQAGVEMHQQHSRVRSIAVGTSEAQSFGNKEGICQTDSKVIAEHVEKEYKAKDPMLEKYLQAICRIEAHFVGFIATHIPRSENKEADTLAKAATQNTPLPAEVFSKTIKAPSIELQGREILSISPNHSED